MSRHGDFEVDHFKPESKFKLLRSDYANLYWACPQCNLAKSGTWPSPSELQRGMRLVDPCADAMADHIRVKGQTAIGLTPAGDYTIEVIDLNSPMHRERRRVRSAAEKLLLTLEKLIANQAKDPRTQAEARVDAASLEALKRQLGTASPWDAPSTCLCASLN